MTTTNDTVLTVAIGRNDGVNGGELAEPRWALFQLVVGDILSQYGTIVCHATTDKGAVASDGIGAGEAEDSAVFIVINPTDIETLRVELVPVLAEFGQITACFSIDRDHEPVFSTTSDGYRPGLEPVEAHPGLSELAAITRDFERALDAGLAHRIADGPATH